MKAARYVRSGSMAYMGIMAQVQAEQEPKPRPIAYAGGKMVYKRDLVEVRYIMRFNDRYTRMWGTYMV